MEDDGNGTGLGDQAVHPTSPDSRDWDWAIDLLKDLQEIGRDASSVAARVFVCYLVLTTLAVGFEAAITTSFTVSAVRLFGTDVGSAYFVRTRTRAVSKVVKKKEDSAQ